MATIVVIPVILIITTIVAKNDVKQVSIRSIEPFNIEAKKVLLVAGGVRPVHRAIPGHAERGVEAATPRSCRAPCATSSPN
jgi:hypothetical protein